MSEIVNPVANQSKIPYYRKNKRLFFLHEEDHSMDRIVDCAQYLITRYKEISGVVIDEMRLHKLLYFTQRQSFAEFGEPAFKEDFEGWKFGPVSREVKRNFYEGEIIIPTREISGNNEHLISSVIYEYGEYADWKLDELIKKESSFQNARKDLTPYQNGTVVMKLDDIKRDAEKIRLFDHEWGMYYDEFDDMFDIPEGDEPSDDR